MKKLNVGVLMGGKSQEREVSLNSGRTICDHLDIFAYNVIPLFQTTEGTLYILPWRFLHRGKTTDFVHKLSTDAQEVSWDDLKELVDFVYIAQHGRYGEDGCLQGLLEVLDIPYLGSKVFASALGMDKHVQKQFLQQADIRTPRGVCVQFSNTISSASLLELLKKNQIAFPCIVKPRYEGSSFGVSVVHSEKALYEAVVKAAQVNKDRLQDVLIEEKIVGMEFSLIVIASANNELQPLLPTEVVYEKNTEFWDYNQKYMPGRSLKFTPARCSQDALFLIQETCKKVVQTLDMTTIARIDGFLTSTNDVVIIDPNSFSGAAPSSFLFKQAAEVNMSHTQLINHLIEVELRNYNLLSNEMSKSNTKKMKIQKKTRVAVLMGGNSEEKEISLESGRNVFYKLSPYKYEPIALYVSKKLELYKIDQKHLVCNATAEIEHALENIEKIKWSDLPKMCDFVFIALHGGHGENGSVQGTLEMLDLPYNGSGVLTSALCIDKFQTNHFLRSKGFATPVSKLITKDTIVMVSDSCNFPAIIKPYNDGCSVGVHKANNPKELMQAAEQLFGAGKKKLLLEEYISGIELTVGVLGNDEITVLIPSQAVAAQGILSIEEKFLPGQGENQTPANLPQAALDFVQKTIAEVYRALECKGYSRIDCFYQNEKISPTKQQRLVILEVNTLPGLTPATCIFHQAAEIGLKPMEFIDNIIQLGLALHAPKKALVRVGEHKELS